MRSKIQVELVARHKKYLEEQIQVLEPVMEVMKQAVEKSQTWIEDKNDNPSLTYIEIHQDLESATLLLINATTSIMNENQEHADVEKGTPSLSQFTLQSTATEKRDISTDQVTKDAQPTPEIVSKLKLIETNLVSLQDTKQKAEDEISELKQWRDNFLAAQNVIELKVDQLTKNQNQSFESLTKQIEEQDNKVKELNKEIESLKEKETKSNKTLEKLSLDMKEYENNLHKINKDVQDHTDKTDSITQEIKRLYDLIVCLQEDIKNNAAKLGVMYGIVQQRMMPIDKMIQILNQNFEAREQTIKKTGLIETDLLTLMTDFKLLETRVCQPYICQIYLDNTPVTTGLIISTFPVLREHNGSHFNRTTGKLEAPDDGLYLVIVTLVAGGNYPIFVQVAVGELKYKTIYVKADTISACGSTVVPIKKGQELYFKVQQSGPGSFLQKGSGFTILRI